MFRLLPLLTAALLMLVLGLVEARYTNRWEPDRRPQEAADLLNQLPLRVGGWQAESHELPKAQVEMARVSGYVSRRYSNRRGQHVSILVLCGSPSLVSRHTPDFCYTGQGYEERDTVQSRDVVQGADFWVGRFIKDGPEPDALRIFWSFSNGGPWSTPGSPRLTFINSPVLYKIYAIHSLTRPDDPIEQDPSPELLRLLLPQLKKYQVAPPL